MWRAIAVGATLLALTGCAGASSTGGGSTVGPDPTAHPTASPAPTPTAACPESESQGPWGDVIAAEQLTDAAGSYCHTTIDPAAPAAQFDPAVVDLDSLAGHGFTIEDAEAAQQVAVSYVAEQGLDSSRLDDYSIADGVWFETAKGQFSPAAQARLAPQMESFGLREAGVIMTQSLPAPLQRDGGPRASSTEISVDKIFGTLDLDQVTPLLVVRVPFAAAYAATDAAIVDAAIRNERGTDTMSEETLRASTPSLFDGVDAEGLLLTGGFTVGFGAGDMAAVAYIGSAWTLATGDGALQIDAVEPELDPALR